MKLCRKTIITLLFKKVNLYKLKRGFKHILSRVVEGANPYGYAAIDNKPVGDGTLTSHETEPAGEIGTEGDGEGILMVFIVYPSIYIKSEPFGSLFSF